MRFALVPLLIVIGVTLTVLADVVLKKSGIQNLRLFLLGLALYAVVAFPVALAFRLSEFGSLFIAWEAATVVLGLVIASAVFKEALTIQRLLAALFAIAALALSYGH
jgi:multidrug transporter EmrE-like cation transporter